MQTKHFFGVMLAGMTLGGLVGILTRPSYIGVQPPVSILFASGAGYGPARNELMSHLAMYIGIGAIAAGLLLFLITYIANNRQPRV